MRRYITIASLVLACVAASAQNLNPTVQVTNDYEGKLMEVDKQNLQMAVPDSLLKFDWNFNYSVFDNPYKGAYEFTPYRIEMKPEATRRDDGRFYLRAGAGWTLHPEAQAVFTPATKGRFGISVYDDFKGYSGLYHNIVALEQASGPSLVGPDGDYSGYGFNNRAGATLRYDAPSAVVTLDGGFDLLRTRDKRDSGNSAMGGSATLRARSIAHDGFLYDISLGWKGLGNNVTVPQNNPYVVKFTEYDAGLDAKFVYRIAEKHSLRLEPSWHHVMFNETHGSATADAVDLAPSYVFADGGFSVKLGVRYSDVWREADHNVAEYKGNKLFPDVRVYFEAVPDKLVLSAKVTGGQRFNTYRSYLESNPHLSYLSSRVYGESLGDATVNTFDVGAGISGRVRSRFQYSAEAGYARYFNAPMDRIGVAYFSSSDYYDDFSVGPYYLPYINMVNYDLLYATVRGDYVSDRLDAAATLKLQRSDFGQGHEKGLSAMTLPLFSGSAKLVYNWNKRVFAGLTADWATSRDEHDVYISYEKYIDCHMPGWVDLGVTAEYRLNSRLSLWAEGRNLLNQTVMRDFLIAEKGRYFTAGICLNF